MTLRIGVDLDGTVANLSRRYHEFETKMFGLQTTEEPAEPPEETPEPTDKEKLKAAKAASTRRDGVWKALRATENLWETLDPIEPGAVRALFDAMIAHRWEIFFITQRPATAGASVQLQTQRWLIAQGFESPSVLTLTGSRGKAAHALELDFLIDDLPKNCVDAISDSRCRPILVLRHGDEPAADAARRLNIGVVKSVNEAIQLLSNPPSIAKESTITHVLKRLGLVR